MKTLYPIVKRSKTSLGRPIPEEYGVDLYYCPKCNRRLSGKKVDNNNYWVRDKVLKPIYCQGCGSLIHPLPKVERSK